MRATIIDKAIVWVRRLNGYKVDRVLRNDHKRIGKDSYPEYNDRDRIRRNDQ
jgi:hypothetical protein